MLSCVRVYGEGRLGVVPRSVVPHALHIAAWGCISGYHPRSPGQGGACAGGGGRSPGRSGTRVGHPAPQHGAGGDGPQRTLFGECGAVRCGPRLSLGV